MAISFHLKISRLVFGSALILFLGIKTSAQPLIEVVDGNVWVKNIDKEVLYTFTRYHHSQTDWQAVFPVRLKEVEADVSIAGTYDVFETSVKFTPRFPFVAGVQYKATFFTEQLSNNPNEVYLPKMTSETLTLEFKDKKSISPPSRVISIYPSTDVVPENLLKFHIRFSNAMTVGEIYQRVKLLDHENKTVEKAFLIVDQEFWDEEMKVATLLLDPGRIKRGLKANVEMSPPLHQGETYTLMIEPNWKDINGNFLQSEFKKTFQCTGADRTSPSVDQWNVIQPKTISDLLVVQMNEPLNILSLMNGIMVKNSIGESIEGDINSLKDEMGFTFRPKKGWKNEKYILYINPLIEDLAGNNLNRVFDKDLKTTTDTVHKKELQIPFTVNANSLSPTRR